MPRQAQYALTAAVLLAYVTGVLMLGLALGTPPDSPAETSQAVAAPAWLEDAILILVTLLVLIGLVMVIGFLVMTIGMRKKKKGEEHGRVMEGPKPGPAAAAVALLVLAAVLTAPFILGENLVGTLNLGMKPNAMARGDVSVGGVMTGLAQAQLEARDGGGEHQTMSSGWLNLGMLLAGIGFLVGYGAMQAGRGARRHGSAGKTRDDDEPLRDRITSLELIEVSIRAIEAEPDPRRAIIACYEQFEVALAHRGFAVPESYTPVECLETAFRRFNVSPEPLWSLTTLFEKARFSTHEVTGEDKAAAAAALAMIRSSLTAPSSAGDEPLAQGEPAG